MALPFKVGRRALGQTGMEGGGAVSGRWLVCWAPSKKEMK